MSLSRAVGIRPKPPHSPSATSTASKTTKTKSTSDAIQSTRSIRWLATRPAWASPTRGGTNGEYRASEPIRSRMALADSRCPKVGIAPREFYAFRAHATSASQGRSSRRRLRSSASAKAAFCFRLPAKRTSAARTACASSRVTIDLTAKTPMPAERCAGEALRADVVGQPGPVSGDL